MYLFAPLFLRQLVFNHRQALAEQLRSETDPAMTLHLAAVLLFMVYTQCMVHAPGRCVPQLLSFLKDYIKKEAHQNLVQLQGIAAQCFAKRLLLSV